MLMDFTATAQPRRPGDDLTSEEILDLLKLHGHNLFNVLNEKRWLENTGYPLSDYRDDFWSCKHRFYNILANEIDVRPNLATAEIAEELVNYAMNEKCI
jgi:hypothetical protein